MMKLQICEAKVVRPQLGISRDAVRARGDLRRGEGGPGGCAFATASRVPAGVLLIAALMLLPRPAHPQEFRGTISGTVTDTSGAVVPGAQVTATEGQTGTVSHAVSDGSGQYVIPFLQPGSYMIKVTAKGFETTQHAGVALETQGHPLVNVTLRAGAISETVTVSGAPPLIDLANASVGAVIPTHSVEDLPINGRTPTTLTELAPGVITTAAPQLIHPFDNNAGNEWSIGGTPNQVSEVLLDGAPDLTLLGALAYAPTQDSVSEVSIRPFDTDASFGHTIGGVINQVTKSGTNELHGTAYEFGQVNTFDANTYFNKRNALPVPGFHYNQYGLTAGGPLWVPKVFNGRDKLFWFFAWEGLKDETPATTIDTVPTADERNGNFAETLAASSSNQLYNPFTATTSGGNVNRTPIANNDLTTLGVAFNPIALNYLKLFPAPNATSGVGSDGSNNYISNAPSSDTYNNEFGRMDFNASARDHVFFDFRHNYRFQEKNNYFSNGATGTTLLRENLGATLDNVFTLNPTTFFDTRLNWLRFNEVHGTPAQAYNPVQMGFPSYMNSNSEHLQLPYINFNTGGSCGSFTSYQCLGDTGSALDPTTSYQFFTDVVKVLGQHTLKVGFDGRQYRISIQNFGDSSGSFTFNSSWVNSGTKGGVSNIFGGDLASFMLGLPASGEYDLEARSDYHQYYIGTFVQDDWHASSRLTLNLGLRFDIDTPFEERNGVTVNGFNPTAPINYVTPPVFGGASVSSGGDTWSVSAINTLGGLTFPSSHNGAVYATNNGFFSPRFGFSYGVNDKTVMRGGFGIFVQPETLTNLNASGTYSSSAISNSEGFSASTSYVATTNNYQTPATTLSDPFPGGSFLTPAGSSQGASTFVGQSISFLAPSQHDPYSERWDLDTQRTLSGNSMIELIYVGNHAVHLPIEQQNLNATERQYLSTTPWENVDMETAYGGSEPNPFEGTLPSVNGTPNSTSTNTSSKVKFSNFIVPYPQFGTSNVYIQNQTRGQSWFESGIVHFEKRASHGFTATANYSFSKLIEADTFLNDQDATPTRRISPFDHVHHFTVGGTYNLPFGGGTPMSMGGSRLWNEVAGGWVLNAIYQFQTGAPIEFSGDIPLQPSTNVRQIKNQPRNTSPVGSGTPALSTNLFVTGNSTSCPSSGPCDGSSFVDGQYFDHLRTLPQTLSWVRGDGFNNLDASVLKNFYFTEKAYLQLRFETFNTLNHPIFAAPSVSSATSSSFGYITSATSNSEPRQIQLGGRIVF